MEDRDFIDFEFNGHWASEFNLLAVSNGDRYSNSFYGSVNPNTVEMVGKTGVYKWKTQIGEKRFSINIAYDDIDLGTLRKIKEWLNPFVISKLTFKEEPYKYYWVSLADDPEISFLPFRTDDVVVDGKSYKKGVFKGDVTLNFICADNFGYSDWQSFDEDYDYLVKEISDVSNFSFDNGSDNNLIITEIKGNSVQDVVKPVAYTHVEGKNLGLKSQYKGIRNLKVLGASQQEKTTLGTNLCPGIEKWTLSGGAYIENGYIVFPSAGAKAASPYIPNTANQYMWYFNGLFYSESEKNSSLVNAQYSDQNKSVINSNGNASTIAATGSDWKLIWGFGGSSSDQYGQALHDSKYVQIIVTYSSKYSNGPFKIKQPMVSLQNVSTFEEFTPNSPSPEYPSKIQNVGDNVKIVIRNKNFCDLDILENIKGKAITINNRNSFTINLGNGGMGITAATNIMLPNDIEKNKKYRIKYHRTMNNTTFLPYIKVIYADGSMDGVNDINLDADYEYVTKGAEISSITLAWNTQSKGGIVTFSNISITEVDEDNDFEESKKEEIIFPLEEGQKLYEGSYLAADGIHNTRKQVVLTGNENIFESQSGTYQTFGIVISGIKQGTKLMSNYFTSYPIITDIKYKVGMTNNNVADRLYISNGESSKTKEFKAWLSQRLDEGIPVIIEYELATEEIISYTTTQRQIYDKLKTLTVKDGYIHLSVDGLGSISLDYNGYDGSPSPAYPSKIRTVGSNINLFDKDNYTELSLQLAPSTKTLNTSRNERGTYFKCKPNTVYSFQKSTNGTVYLRGNICETQVIPTDGCSYDNYVSFSLINKISYKTSATAKYIYFNFYCTASDIPKQELLNSIKIEEEPENTALSAYNKANIETKIENANYYNPANGFNYGAGAANTTTVNADGTITTNSNYSNSRGKGTPVYLKKNTNYYLSLELVSLTVSAGDEKHIAAEVIGYNKFGGGANRVSQIFNIRQTEIGTRWVGQFNSGDCDRWALHISGWFGISNEGTATYKNVMISEQNIDYVPNETQTVTMPIQQELLTGDYIKDTEHHEWGKLVVTGQENWNQYNRSLTDGYFGAFLAKDDVKNTGIVVCNKLPRENDAVYNTTGYGVANFMEGYLYICLRREDFGASDTTSLADCTTLLKAYLAKCYADGDPFIIYYKVKKPVDLELTQEQKNSQNFAKNFVFSYPGTNRVYADNDVVKLSASYVPEQNINIDFMVEGSNLLDSSAFYYQNDIFLKAFEDKEGGDATKSGISEEKPVYLYNAGNKDAALKLDFDLIIPAENSPLTIQIEKGKMTENGFSKISDYSQITINNFAHYRPFVDIFDGHLENWQIEIDSNLCEVYVKHKTDKTKIISLNKFNENQSFLSLAGSEIVDYAKAFPTSLEEIKNSAIEDTIFNKVTIAPCAQNYRLKNVSLDWKHTYL